MAKRIINPIIVKQSSGKMAVRVAKGKYAEIDGSNVKVIYSLTSMACPVGPMIEEEIGRVVREVPGVDDVKAELTFDPPWTPEMMSEDAKFILGF